MCHSRKLATALICATVSLASGISGASAAMCTATGFFRDGNNLTARFINPGTLSAPVDAQGCDIGVYQNTGTLTLTNVEIFGARYFGVFANADARRVTVHLANNIIHNMGDGFGSGNQRGVGIYLRAFFTSNLLGEVTANRIFAYQKGGIVASGRGVKTPITENKVVGWGPVPFITQNGIEVGFGAEPGEVTSNEVKDNSYSGPEFTAATGILLDGGPYFDPCPDGNTCPYTTRTHTDKNIVSNNDVGVYMFNSADGVSGPPTPTKNVTSYNVVRTHNCSNPYTVGISDLGNSDKLVYNNVVSGGGYDPPCGAHYDTSGSINPVLIPYPGTSIQTSAANLGVSARPRAVPFGF